MKFKIFLLTVCSLFLIGNAFASLNALETAVIAQDYQSAKELALDLLGTDLPADEVNEVRFYLALSHLRLSEYDQAKQMFQDLIKQPIESQLRDRAYLGLFNAYYLNEEYKEAVKTIDRLYELSPRSSFLSLIYLKMARVNLKLTNWRKAREHLKRIINDYPNSMEASTAKQLLAEKQYFAVQVGAFLDRQLAEKQVEKLRQNNEYAYIVETVDKDERTFYRVRVGQMTLLDDARELKTRLSRLGYPTEIYP
jgi:tetratricopeptide (TPR) repeat protein